ncbi:MarR family EPS-associated transcriptional regulator [Herbaspirillum sp. LeCh32-8]|uniref:MarR family EPS-associated transcriptional regulator n=1 Tax=Herbaspirillum sp. LeCh32-8 TaxID=2821356 RepID=UPI001AE51B68|nr:MarR family EPS-associated transcriptional regulator [Herbaspirillum sp. LeCh32-8]MBP0598367.1 MarR family EPS-associated transcriptional regulator [Herbaspirillum sp. LeCh32-8]
MSPQISTSEVQLHVLRLLAQNPQIKQREVATELGMSLGKVNYCIKALFNKGFIKVDNFKSSKNKLSYIYLLTPAGIAAKAELTGQFLKVKMLEYEALQHEIETLRAEWISHQEPV